MPWSVGVVLFAVLVFIIGCAMGIGKAAVYKHIPEYFPRDVGAVGGLVGSLGALGGFFLPLLFAYTARWTGMPQSTFFVLFAVTAVAMLWMHLTIHRMLHAASPELANKFENDQLADPAAAHEPCRARRGRRHHHGEDGWLTWPHPPRPRPRSAGVLTGSRAGPPRTPRPGTPAGPGRPCGSPRSA